jgi:hypothetical protein
VKKYGLYSLILLFLVLGRIIVVPLLISNENSSYVRIIRYQILRDYPYHEFIQELDMNSAMKLSGYPMETIVALDVLFNNSFNLERANEAASSRIMEITGGLDQGLLETTKTEVAEIFNFYHIKGIFTALLLNLIVILVLATSLFMKIEHILRNRKAERKRAKG